MLLAHNSSRRRPDQDRWTELEIYSETEPVNAVSDHASNTVTVVNRTTYRVVISGYSTRPGETLRTRTEETTSPEFVVDLCAPKDRVTGRPTLTAVGRKTLMEAALLDEAIAAALESWQAVHA